MKQIIEKYSNSIIYSKYYVNDKGYIDGLLIRYCRYGDIWFKRNYLNSKLYGLETLYKSNGRIQKYEYFL